MSEGGATGEAFGQVLAAFFGVVFVLTFPLVLITLPIVSFILMIVLPTPQFGFLV